MLSDYIKEKNIDAIEDDQLFMEEEYETVREYCKRCNYIISSKDIREIRSRGLEYSYDNWKQEFVSDLYQEI